MCSSFSARRRVLELLKRFGFTICAAACRPSVRPRRYGDDPNGSAPRIDTGDTGRFRCFTRDEISARGDNLDLTWLRDAADAEDSLQDPADIAAVIMGHLRSALAEIEALSEELMESEAFDLPEAAE